MCVCVCVCMQYIDISDGDFDLKEQYLISSAIKIYHIVKYNKLEV